MHLDQLFKLFQEAKSLCKHGEFVVVGSLSVLGLSGTSRLPASMTMSIDVDCYTKADPGRIRDLQEALGENSPYHREAGIFLDPVSPSLPTLPPGWEHRLMLVERDGVRLWFLEPNDAAVSKYARGEPRDRRWIRGGVEGGVVSLPMVRFRFRDTVFLDDEESRRARTLLEEDEAWLAGFKTR